MTPREFFTVLIAGLVVFGIAYLVGRWDGIKTYEREHRKALGKHHAREQKSGDREV